MDPTGKLLTTKQIAATLGVSDRTIRRWCIAFHTSLSETASRKGGKRFFTANDLGILKEAQVLFIQGKTTKEVAAELPHAELTSTEPAFLLTGEEGVLLGTALERTASLSLLSQDHEDRLVDHDDDIEELKKRLADLEWQNLPWWKRLFQPPKS